MTELAVNTRWIFAVVKLSLLYAVLLQDHFCEASCINTGTRIKNILFISPQNLSINATFPTDAVYINKSGKRLCFNLQENKTGCCSSEDFDCSPKISLADNCYNLTLTETALCNQDVIVLQNPTYNFSCMPSTFYKSQGLMLNIHNCLKMGGPTIRLSQGHLFGNSTLCGDSWINSCQNNKETTTASWSTLSSLASLTTNVTSQPATSRTTTSSPTSTLTSQPATLGTTTSSPTTAASSTTTSSTIPPMVLDNDPKLNSVKQNQTDNTENAANIMRESNIIVGLMGNRTIASIVIGKSKGVFAKLTQQNQTNKNFVFTSTGDVKISESNNLATEYTLSVHLPKEASEMAVKKNGSYIGILLFPEIPKINATSSFFNNQILGIEMGVNISNLSETINIQFRNVNTTELSVSCVSWDGRSNQPGGAHNWITDGCKTIKVNSSVTCQCSHLTFFAILMSSGNKNISSSDLKTLTQITKAGCGISLFFLGVALFMHFLVRKNKASETVKILMNLFVALFLLNLCFLVNETIANLKVSAACVAMAAALHYSMLATFTWFFIQALHLYFNLHQISTDIKYYMCKICSAGWVIPALLVIGLLASSNYGTVEISDNNGTSVKMCWIPDSTLHLGVNIGYYGIVFIFTFTIFIVAVVQITKFASKADKDTISTKKRFFSLLGLFCLLGISWGFAFFSYGPLLLPSFYIFTILNSFQGFFLFVYYYFSSRIQPEDRKVSESSTRATENVYISSPYA